MEYQIFKTLVEFDDFLSNFVGVLQQFVYSTDFSSSSHSKMVTGNLPVVMRRKWLGNFENHQSRSKLPSLMDLVTWLQEQAVVHERLLSFMKASRYDLGKPNGVSKRGDSKNRSDNFEAVVSDKKNTNQCPLQDGFHRIWTSDAFKMKSIDDRYKILKEEKLCLHGGHQIKDRKTRKCVIDGCEIVHNRLLHKAVKSVEPAVKKEETNLTTIRETIARGALQVVPVRVHGKLGLMKKP